MPDIRLPDGRLIKNVPEGTTKDQLASKLIGAGVLSGQEEWLKPQQEEAQPAQQQAEEQPQPQNQFANIKSSFLGVSDEKLRERIQNVAKDAPARQRIIGLGARAAAQGVGGAATLPYDLAILGINTATGSNIKSGSQIVSEGLDVVGLPKPKTAGERIGSTVVEGAIGARSIAKGAQYAKPTSFVKKLSTGNVAADTAAGAGAGLGSSVAGEITENPLARLGAGIAGGVIAGGAANRLARPQGQTPKILEDVVESGIDETAAFSNVRASVQKEAAKQEKQVAALFNRAAKKGKGAYIEGEDLAKFSNGLRQSVSNNIDIEGQQLVSKTADVIDGLSKQGAIDNSINQLQSLRRQATAISASNRPSSHAAGNVVRRIDSFLDKVNIKGDQEAANLWKNAISKSRNYFRTYSDPAKIAQAIDSDQTLETIEKSFLGSGSVSGQKDLAKTYQETVKAVDPTKAKDVGFAMRQSALNKMIKEAAKSSDSAEGLSASRLSNSIRNLRRENQSFWKEFSSDEKQILSKLEVELRKTSEGGVINKVYQATEKLLRKGLRSNVELPRTLKPKTIVTVEDLLELASTRPPLKSTTPISTYSTIPQATKENNQ